MSADAFCTRDSRQVRNASRAKFRPGKMRKNYDLCGTCRHADGSRGQPFLAYVIAVVVA